jgi:hypothetical protein
MMTEQRKDNGAGALALLALMVSILAGLSVGYRRLWARRQARGRTMATPSRGSSSY